MGASPGAIVVGVDGSRYGERALHWAVELASREHAAVHVLYALPQSSIEVPFTTVQEGQHAEFAEHLVARARGLVQARGLPVTSDIVNDSPGHALVAASPRARSVVVGARGHSALCGRLLGSVSQHVCRHAQCPVIVVREPVSPRASRVVVGVDGSPSSDHALGFAFDVAAHSGTTVVAVHAWPDSTEEPDRAAYTDAVLSERLYMERRTVADALDRWREKYPAVPVTQQDLPGKPARILNAASERAALVVLGARGQRSHPLLSLGSVTQSVLHHASCPVAVVH